MGSEMCIRDRPKVVPYACICAIATLLRMLLLLPHRPARAKGALVIFLVEWHRVSAIASGGRGMDPRCYWSASAIARSLRQASATASPRARAASSCTSAGSRRSKKRRFLQNRDLPRKWGSASFVPGLILRILRDS